MHTITIHADTCSTQWGKNSLKICVLQAFHKVFCKAFPKSMLTDIILFQHRHS